MSAAFDYMLASLKHHVAAMINLVAQPRWGVITSYDNVNHLVKVTIQPENTSTTGWLPLLSSWVGAGWGEVTPPNVGQQVKLIYENGDNGSPVAVAAAYSTANPPPKCYSNFSRTAAAPQTGERLFVSKAGAMMRMCADGSLYFLAPTGINLDGNVVVSQNLTVLGNLDVLGTEAGSTGALTTAGEISDLNGVHGTVDTLRSAHNMHGHPGVQLGGSITPTPNEVTP